jgi:ABC-type dipeptide/oligopeptide/nickel transport system permease subunit
MQRVEPTVSLRAETSLLSPRQIPIGKTIAICLLITFIFRVIVFGLVSLLSLIPQLDFLTSILREINNLNFLVALPFGIGVYIWATSGQQESLLIETISNLFRSRSAVIGMTIIALLVLTADFAPSIAPYDPILSMIGQPGETGKLPARVPCIGALGCTAPQHIMGLDLNARDLFSRVVFGSRTSLTIGIASVSFAIVIGTTLGLTAGYVSGWTDNIIMRIMDVLLAFPSLLLAITIVTIKGPGLENALLAIAIVSIPVYARLSRASVLAVKELEFVTAERALGAAPARILFRQILPNILTPLIVQGTLGIGGAVLEAAGLSFLGLGAQPPTAEWGQMLSEARNYVFTAPHLVFFPGFAIMLTVLGFNLLGDGLRDALDPRLNRI